MKDFLKDNNKQKHQFRSYYCLDCKQVKSCGILSKEYCCSCTYQLEREKAEEYSDYQQVYQRKVKEKKEHEKQLLLLKSYQGCKRCGSLTADAYILYENSQLVCQPCRMKKEGGASGSVNFLEQQKWYKKWWKIDLAEWLGNFSQLPVNAECAKKWLKDKEHLKNCDCLEKEVQELVELFTNSLKDKQELLKKCVCVKSEKVRVDYLDSEGSGWIECQICEKRIESAGHHGVIKNRNSPNFWGLNIKEKALCLKCLEKFQEQMPISKRYMLNKYLKRGY